MNASVDSIQYDANNLSVGSKRLILYEKEKGGVGSTGTLMTHAHAFWCLKVPFVLVEASLTQRDIANPYEHFNVRTVDLKASDAAAKMIDIVEEAPRNSYILVNVPGGQIEELDETHQVLGFANEEGFDAETTVLWTLGLDAASRITLEALIESKVPGSLLVNLPEWAGSPDALRKHLGEDLRAKIAAIGDEIVTPSMPTILYDLFRQHQISPDRFVSLPTFTFGKKATLRLWESRIVKAVEQIF